MAVYGGQFTSFFVIKNYTLKDFQPTHILLQLYKLDLHSKRFTDLGPMPVWSDHVTVTCSDGHVFVIGGYQAGEEGSVTPSPLVQVSHVIICY